MKKESTYVRIKIDHSKENKAKGFYLLMTNGSTYSDKKDEFIIEKEFLKILNEAKVDYKELPLNEDDPL